MSADSATLSPKGQITLPLALRRLWRLEAGARLEFYQDHNGHWLLRPLTAGPLDFLQAVPKRPRLAGAPDIPDIDLAIANAIVEDDISSKKNSQPT